MDCPLCKVKLHLADRQGVEIDYCPECRGIWLDRGELEKLVDLSASQSAVSSPPPFRHDDSGRADHYTDRRDESHYRSNNRTKKESWLSKLLEFD